MSLFPITVFLEPWNNVSAQLSFLSHAIRLTPEIFTMNQLLTKKVIPLDAPSRNNLAASVLNSASTSPWNCIELVSFLLSLSESSYTSQVAEIVEIGGQQSPDLLLLAIAQLYAEQSTAQNVCEFKCRLIRRRTRRNQALINQPLIRSKNYL
jgi:hypothetical protein